MEKVKNNKRIEWIDSLKGAMMLAVFGVIRLRIIHLVDTG